MRERERKREKSEVILIEKRGKFKAVIVEGNIVGDPIVITADKIFHCG